MKLKNTLFTLFLSAALTASAIPAKRGAVYQMTQPDGTVVDLEIVGDEFHHYYLTTDGKAVLGQNGKYCYASINEYGEVINSGILAHNVGARDAYEVATISSVNTELIKTKIMTREAIPMSRANSQDGNGKTSTNFPTKGNLKSLVFLVSYDDVDFVTDDPFDYFSRMLNEEGFSDFGGKGSCRDYYIEASAGQFVPEFDVYGPIKLPQPRAYYGENGMTGFDIRPQEMMLHAAQILNDEVDFSQYDLDGDMFVDNVYIFYAGMGEAQGGGDETIWPHQSSIGRNSKYKFDGVYFNRYACGSELADANTPDGIGTFCHEFGHVLGLPDLYNTVNSDVDYTPCEYSIMDQGCYNDNGHNPPTFSAYERNALKWMGDNLVEITGPASCRLEHILTSNMAYLINTDKPNEYFLFENRQKVGRDAQLPGNGMLIWHIDYNKTIFTNNTPNNTASHQRIDLVEANGTTSASRLTKSRYPFPGKTNKTSFVYGGIPNFAPWSGVDLGLPITDIKEVNGIITFNVAGGGADPAGIDDVAVDAKLICNISDRNINVVANGSITVSDICGRVIAVGADQLNAEIPTAGIYIISTPQGSKKLQIK